MESRRIALPKFFVPSEQPFGSALVLTGENAAHARVLRLKCGDSVTVCDAHGTDYACTVDSVQPGEVSLCVNASAPSASEPSVRCSVYMAYAKADKLEHVIQKATELGAAEIALYSFREALAHASHAELRLLHYENEQSLSLRAALEGSPLRTVAVMTGPEGGFEPDEVALAQEYGFQSCTLGPRILRCETAPLCALTAILYAAGALD